MTVSSAAQVAARMEKVATAVTKAHASAVKQAVGAVQSSVQSFSPSRLSGVGKSGAKLSVSVKVTGGTEPQGSVKAVGPWQLIEYDTSKHLITPKGAAGSRAARVRAAGGSLSRRVAFGAGRVRVGSTFGPGSFAGVRGHALKIGSDYFAGARHPGTKGKMVFHKGVDRGIPKAVAVLRRTNVAAVKEAFS